jgi:hypothetical protein
VFIVLLWNEPETCGKCPLWGSQNEQLRALRESERQYKSALSDRDTALTDSLLSQDRATNEISRLEAQVQSLVRTRLQFAVRFFSASL